MVFGENERQNIEVYFDRFRGEMEVQHLRMTNIGVTTVYYNWSRQFRDRSFQSQPGLRILRFLKISFLR